MTKKHRPNRPCVIALMLMMACLAPSVGAESVKQLEEGLRRIFDDEHFSDAIWGIQVESLDRGEIIYQHNADKLLMPASNQKLLIGAAILLELGPTATFDTHLYHTGPIEDGVLNGDLVVRGGGDPSLGGRFHDGDITHTLRDWARILKRKGIKRIRGSVVGDDNIFDDQPYGEGWQIGDLAHWYAAAISALSFNDNCLDIIIKPNPSLGKPALLTLEPPTEYLKIINKTETVKRLPRGKSALREVDFWRQPDSRRLHVRGPVLAKAKRNREWASVPNPTLFTVTAFTEVLEKEGIAVDGNPADIDNRDDLVSTADSPPASWTLLHLHRSPPLSDLLGVYMKKSQNLYGECFLKYLGHARGQRVGSAGSGLAVAKELLEDIGVPLEGIAPVDGSGLSRRNLLTANAVCRLLRGMAEGEHGELYMESLPRSSKDGTLANRMKNTAAAGRVYAKTGYISRVRTLSGYVKSKDGETFVFSFLANNFRAAVKQAQSLQDRACILLATFSRED